MNWTKDALFSKAKLFIEKAAAEDKDSSYYGIFSALALELLARAALANIHPTLLADADANQKNVLYALDRLDSSASPKSIMTKQVIALCGSLIPDFNSDLQKLALSMTERRNEELHSGGAAFQEYNQDLWIGSFYKACQVLTASMGESLASFLGKRRAEEAETLISENDTRVKKEVLDKISARRKIYEEDIAANKEMLDKQQDDIDTLKHVMNGTVLASLKNSIIRKLRYAEGRLDNGLASGVMSEADEKMRREEIIYYSSELEKIFKAEQLLNNSKQRD